MNSDELVLISDGVKGRVVRLSDIRSFSVEGNYLTAETTDGEKIMMRGSLKRLLAKLNGGDFVPISRACVVNLASVREAFHWGKGVELTLDNGSKLLASKSCSRQLIRERSL